MNEADLEFLRGMFFGWIGVIAVLSLLWWMMVGLFLLFMPLGVKIYFWFRGI